MLSHAVDYCRSEAGPGSMVDKAPEPVFLNVYGALESIPRNEFRQPS